MAGNVTPVAPAPAARLSPEVFGTGLPAGSLSIILGLMVAVFLLWDGPLWRAPLGTSHVARIAVSYLAALPAVAVALACAPARGRSDGPRAIHLVNAVGVLWAAKLLVTSSLYGLLVPGPGDRYHPERAWERHAPATRHTYGGDR